MRTTATLFCLTLLFVSRAIAADSLTLSDGSTLQGRLVSIEDGFVQFETSFAGTLSIATEQVSAIETEGTLNVEFDDGSRIVGQVETVAGKVRVTSATAENTSPLTGVTAAWLPGQPDPALREAEAKLREWSFEVAAGFTGKTGNSESTGVDFAGNAILKGPSDELKFYGNYRYSESDGQVSADDTRGGVRYLNNFSGEWLWFVRGEIGRDAVKDLDVVTEASGGFGYQILASDNHNLRLLAGIAHRSEVYGTGRTESFPAADATLEHDYSWNWGKIVNSLNYIQSLSDTGQYNILQTTAIELPLANSESWKIRAGFENDYDGSPDPGVNKLDTTYFSRLVYSFE